MRNEIEYLFSACSKMARRGISLDHFGDILRYKAEEENPIRDHMFSRSFNQKNDRAYVTNEKAIWRNFRRRFRRSPPTFMLARPSKMLRRKPGEIRVAIITGGGIASGLNRVIHSIVRRHYEMYGLNERQGGIVYGIRDGFRGLSTRSDVRVMKLDPERTKEWADRGGTMLGSLRFKPTSSITAIWYDILIDLDIDILYVIGGNGSQTAAYKLYSKIERSKRNRQIAIAGIPKTMDNDIFWTDRSFGFQSSVDEAARIIKAIKEDAFSSRRLCIIQLFGRDSGFVAASASLASGCVDAGV